jgi:putative ABC transport system permease protein
MQELPLAWLQLSKEKSRFLTALAGIAFACILIFIEMGFEQALYKSSIRPHMTMQGDLFLVSPEYQTLYNIKSFNRHKLYQVLGVNGVTAVNSLRISKVSFKNPQNKSFRELLIFGITPEKPAIASGAGPEAIDSLKQLGCVLFDSSSRPEYGPITQIFANQQTCVTEVNKIRTRISGFFQMGASFAADGNLLTSDSTIIKLDNHLKREEIEVGLISLKPQLKPEHLKILQAQIARRLGSSVQVLDKEEFCQRERNYWANSTGIGFIFGLGVAVGLIVGVVIVYQVLWADVVDHLPEFATLKAMGYTDSYLFQIIMVEALILSIVGFIPGLIASLGLYQVAQAATLYPLTMPPERIALVFSLTVAMCVLSGLIASRKLRSADPAALF